MVMDLKDKNAVIIGGVSGIGLACVKEFLKNGVKDKAYFDVSGVRVMVQCPSGTKTKILLGENLYEKPSTLANHQNKLDRIEKVAKQESVTVAEGIVYMIKNGSSGAVYVTRESKTYEVDMPSFLANSYKMKRVL